MESTLLVNLLSMGSPSAKKAISSRFQVSL